MRPEVEWTQFLSDLLGAWDAGSGARVRFEQHLGRDLDWPMVVAMKRGSRR